MKICYVMVRERKFAWNHTKRASWKIMVRSGRSPWLEDRSCRSNDSVNQNDFWLFQDDDEFEHLTTLLG